MDPLILFIEGEHFIISFHQPEKAKFSSRRILSSLKLLSCLIFINFLDFQCFFPKNSMIECYSSNNFRNLSECRKRFIFTRGFASASADFRQFFAHSHSFCLDFQHFAGESLNLSLQLQRGVPFLSPCDRISDIDLCRQPQKLDGGKERAHLHRLEISILEIS